MRNIVLFGTGGMAREIHHIIEDINSISPMWNFQGFLDENEALHGEQVHGFPVLGGLEWLSKSENSSVDLVVGVGNSVTRRRLAESISNQWKGDFATIIHPRACIGNRVKIGGGSVVCVGVIITTDIIIGEHVIVNIGSTISHDTIIEDYVTIAPRVSICGAVRMGIGGDLGAGSIVIQGKSIGAWAIIGAGAVVINDIGANITAVGVPAKPIKLR